MADAATRIPLADPVREYRELRTEIDAAVERVLGSGRYVLGETLEAFETAFAEAVGTTFAVGVASGTDAIELALEGLGIGPGDEVITSPFTFLATAEAVLATGATPVFADVSAETFNVTPEAVEAAVTPRTAALLPVHLFGQMADMPGLRRVAERHGLAVVEDAAQAFGASQKLPADPPAPPARAGSSGIAGCFSFYPTKSLGAAGDAGMITTSDPELAERLRRLRNHGRGREGHHERGHNSRLDAIQAAILHAKLPHVESWTARRGELAALYDAALAETPDIRGPVVGPGNDHIYHQYTVLAEDRAGLRARCEAAGIATATFYDPPLHLFPGLAELGCRPGELPEAERLADRVVNVPVFAHLTAEERARITTVLGG